MNKIILRLRTLYCMIREMQNWLLPIKYALGVESGEAIAMFRDGDQLKVSVLDWKGLPSICRLKRKFKLRVEADGCRVLLSFLNGVKFSLSRESLFWELGVINEVWDWDDYRVANRDLSGKRVVDIGGYIGDSALLFASLGAKVDVFEPFPIAYRMIEKNIDLSGDIGANVKLHPVGLADRNKKVEVFYDSTKISFANTDAQTGNDSEVIELVNVVEYFNEKSITNVDILKIDCEGCEYELISETNLLDIVDPGEIMLEYHSGYADLKKTLEDRGYSVDRKGSETIGLMFAIK